jgi:hypothetical protein
MAIYGNQLLGARGGSWTNSYRSERAHHAILRPVHEASVTDNGMEKAKQYMKCIEECLQFGIKIGHKGIMISVDIVYRHSNNNHGRL